MADDFGSGLDPSAGAPFDISPQAVNAMPDNSAPASPPQPAASQGNPVQQFGSSLASMLPGAHYTPPDPASSALDQSASLLQQRIDRAGKIATNPLAQLFAPEQIQAARDFVPQATEQLRTIAQQKAQVQAGRAQAQTMGLTPDEAPDQATQDDRIQVATAKALKGDMRSFQGLQAVAPDHAAAIAPQVYATVAGHLNNAQLAFDSLASMENEGQYQAKVRELRQNGTLADLESLGLKLPPSFDAFQNTKAAEGLALRNARIATNTIGQQLEDRNTYQPMAKDEAATYDGRLTTAYGDKITNGTWSRNAASNTRGFINNGLATPESLGRGGVLGNADQRKQIGDEFKNAVPPADLEKLRGFNRTYQLAVTDNKGNPVAPGTINTNPNVSQAISESLAALLRGGRGGATAGLLNIEESKRGAVQSVFDKIQSAYAGSVNTLTGEQVRPYLTQLTQAQQRAVLDGLRDYTNSSVTDRSLAIARRAGALGFGADALGLGKDEAGPTVNAAVEEGRQAQIARMRPNFQAIGGGDGVLQLGAQRPGASAIGMPPGAQPYNQLPGAQPLLTPVQQASQNGGPAVTPSPSTGGPRPVPPATQGTGGGTGQPPAPQPSQPVQQPSGPPPGYSAAWGQPIHQAIAQAAAATGLDPALLYNFARIESSGNPKAVTGSYKGLFQLSQAEFNKYGSGDILDPHDNAMAAAAKLKAESADFQQQYGREPTAADLYMIHQQGAAGYAAHMANPDAPAWQNMASTGEGKQKGDNWARAAIWQNVPNQDKRVFGHVDNITSRQFMDMWQAKVGGGTVVAAPEAPPDRATIASALGSAALKAFPPTAPAAYIWDRLSPEQKQTVKDVATENAPAIGSTVGSLVGTRAGLPGSIVGGAVGGGSGQALKDYVQGNAQNPAKIAEEAALGGVLSVASAARPFVAAAGRVIGSGAVEAASTAAQGGSVPDIIDAGLKGAGKALGGEVLGRFVSSAGAMTYKALSRYTTSAQQELMDHAGKLAAAREVLEAEQPKLPGDMGANPKYEAAKQAEEDAIAEIKDHGQNPDDMVHAYEQATSSVPVPRGEAVVTARAQSAARQTSEGYNQLRQDVQNAGVGVPKANQPLPDGPVAQVRTAANQTAPVEAKFLPDAENAEMLVKAPAANWGEKWGQLQQAGTELINKRMTFLANGDEYGAKQMDAIFKGVRNQQVAAAKYVFGPEQGKQVISRLESLDKSWATIMTGSGGLNYAKMQSVLQSGNTPRARAMEKAFKSFAGDDPGAMRAFNAMKAGAPIDWKMMIPVVAGEAAANVAGIPTLGGISAAAAAGLGGQRLYRVMQQYMNAKVLGQPVKFRDFFMKDLQANPLGEAVRSTVQRAAVQGGVPVGEGGAEGVGASAGSSGGSLFPGMRGTFPPPITPPSIGRGAAFPDETEQMYQRRMQREGNPSGNTGYPKDVHGRAATGNK